MTGSQPATPWRRPVLFCLAPAGATASRFYSEWPDWMGDVAEIAPLDVPGRGRRVGVRPAATLAALVRDLVGRASPHVAGGRLWGVFGHSFGALVAYELARALPTVGGVRTPFVALVSGRNAPGHGPRHRLHELDDAALFDEVMGWGGVPEAFRRPALRPLVLHGLHHDLALAATHRHDPDPPLDCPVTVLLGDADSLTDAQEAARWGAATTRGAAVHVFAGGHGYIGDGRIAAPLVRAVIRTGSEPASAIGRAG